MAKFLRASQVWLRFSGTTGTTGILRYYRYGNTTQVWLNFYALLRCGYASQVLQVLQVFSGTAGLGTLLRYGYTSTRYSGVATLLRYYRYYRNSQLLHKHLSGITSTRYSGMARLLRYYRYYRYSQVLQV